MNQSKLRHANLIFIFRYSIAISLGVIPILSFLHGTVVGSFRKAAGVPYPHTYATVEQCKSNVRLRNNPFFLHSFRIARH